MSSTPPSRFFSSRIEECLVRTPGRRPAGDGQAGFAAGLQVQEAEVAEAQEGSNQDRPLVLGKLQGGGAGGHRPLAAHLAGEIAALDGRLPQLIEGPRVGIQRDLRKRSTGRQQQLAGCHVQLAHVLGIFAHGIDLARLVLWLGGRGQIEDGGGGRGAQKLLEMEQSASRLHPLRCQVRQAKGLFRRPLLVDAKDYFGTEEHQVAVLGHLHGAGPLVDARQAVETNGAGEVGGLPAIVGHAEAGQIDVLAEEEHLPAEGLDVLQRGGGDDPALSRRRRAVVRGPPPSVRGAAEQTDHDGQQAFSQHGMKLRCRRRAQVYVWSKSTLRRSLS